MRTSDYGLLELDAWDHLGPAECEVVIRDEVEPRLPEPFRFAGIRPCGQGEHRRNVAFFDRNGSDFALIPGGLVTLGYDRDRPFEPNEAEAEAWAFAREEYGWDLHAYLDEVMSPLRTVTLAPFLIEVAAFEPGKRRIRDRSQAREGSGIMIQGGEVYEDRPLSHREVSGRIAAEGFRLPTSDEWEHACAAGSRTLFHWGPHSPIRRDSPEGPATDRAHLPNAFGLWIASNNYNWEYCTDPTIMRGGDGGKSTCGGEGELVEWLALASPFLCRGVEELGDEIFGGFVRRILSVAWGFPDERNRLDVRELDHDNNDPGNVRYL